jgi:predicted ATPase
MATTFFGREADIEHIERLIGEGRRVITLLGPAGAGKTRLARRIAELHAASHEGGVWFCDLTEARDLQGVLASVGHAVEAPLAKADTEARAIEEIARSIATRGSTLLVIDNCEQVIDAAARVVAKIASLAPLAVQVTTSREALRVPGEQTHIVAPLDVEGDGVRLFIERARSVRPAFAEAEEDRMALVDIVRALDGLPLAIELAAARVAVLGIASIRARLKERFALLAGGPRFASERQRTMRGAIDWSWDLLAPWERAALSRCAAFSGGFDLDAAESVLGTTSADADAPKAMLDVMQSLCEKSLVVADDVPDLGVRFRLLESIKAYALERLIEAKDELATLDRHAQCFARAGSMRAKAAADGDAEARRWIALEFENLRAAHRHSLARATERAPGAANSAFTLLETMAELLRTRGPLDLLMSLLDATLAAPIASQAEPSLVGAALRDRATARHFSPETADAKRADLSRALEIAERVKDVPLEISCHDVFASLELIHGRPDAARHHARAALESARALGERREIAKALGDLASCDLASGRLEEARAYAHEALTMSRALGNDAATAICVGRLAETLSQLGRLDEARVLADEGIALARRSDRHRLLAVLLGNRAAIAHEQGDLPRAVELYDEAHAYAVRAGADMLQPFYRATRGTVLADADDCARAEADVDAAAASVPRFKEEPILAATVAIARGHLELARERAQRRTGHPSEALEHHARAAKELDAIETGHDYEDLRLMRRRFERALASQAGLEAIASEDEASPDALVVAEDGAWFRCPRGEKVDLRSRKNLQRLLVTLTQHRIGARGEPLSLEALFRGGWPGDRADSTSAANRARVAVTRLRQLGLGELLVFEGGYFLDPNVRVVVARAA